MKHKSWYILIAVWMFTSTIHSQVKRDKAFKKTLKEADAAFEMDDFKNAESKYMSIWKKDSLNDNINFNLAVCKFKLKELPDSVLYFLRKADKSTKAEVQYYEGKLYHLTHRFDEAIEHYQQYKKTPQAKREVNDMEIDRLIAISRRAADMMAHPHKAAIKNIGSSINTKYDEYVPLISTDERIMYFTSRRPGGVGNKTDAWGKYYEDIYMTEVVDGLWKTPVNIGPPVNSETHDACVAVSADLQQMIVYRTTPDGTSGDLYHTEQTEKGWGPLVKYGVEINSDAKEFSATFNLENNVIYFSSDRPGGLGGKDIYRTVRLPNGKWSLPWNLGPNVNTPYDEDAPFLHIDGTTLYFSSKGHETMGEYDVFKTTISEDNQFSPAENLGFPINTVGEDIFFVLSADGRHGYYSSLNENVSETGYESEDIYYIDMRYSEADIKVRKGICLDADGKPLTAKITLINSETNKVEGVYTSAAGTGKFVFAINPYYSYKMITDSKGYETNITEIHPLVEDNEAPEDLAELKLSMKKK
jgi:tetratricopeptide (TPR) repeat protein